MNLYKTAKSKDFLLISSKDLSKSIVILWLLFAALQ